MSTSFQSFAQTGEILVLSRSAKDAARLFNTTEEIYDGTVTLASELPDVLNYDAILTVHYGSGDDQLFDSDEQLRMIDYLRSGGKFYGEGLNFRGEFGSQTDYSNDFWDFIGDSIEAASSAFIQIDTLFGVAGTFASGLGFDHPHGPNDFDAPLGYNILGMTGVVQAVGNGPIAYMSPYNDRLAVLHWPVVQEHYDAFLSRVLCSYFSLCALDAPKVASSKLEIMYDPYESSVRLPGPGSVSITDVIGRPVFNTLAASNTLQLPSGLTSGTYIVTWTSSEASASTLIRIP